MSTESVLAAANAFNARAAKENWPSFCDPGLAFRKPELAGLLAVWREKAGSSEIPRRRDITLRCLKTLLPNVALYQRIAIGPVDRRYRVRLIGTRFAGVMGELTGRYVDEAVPPQFLPRWNAALDAALVAGAPLRFLGRTDSSRKSYLVGEYFEAPLLGEDGTPSRVLAASHFSSAQSWDDAWAAERPKVA